MARRFVKKFPLLFLEAEDDHKIDNGDSDSGVTVENKKSESNVSWPSYMRLAAGKKETVVEKVKTRHQKEYVNKLVPKHYLEHIR